MSVPTFVVGTGRCGSTMLSNMLREHPKVLSLSEFFVIVSDAYEVPEAFGSRVMDGRQFWHILAAEPTLMNFALRLRLNIPEYLYPADRADARFARGLGVPGILVTALPHLTDDFEKLFEDLAGHVCNWASAPICHHYRRLFELLADRFGKQQWVERSGGGCHVINEYLATFPDARFIHVTRDGRDAALSMQHHDGFRYGLLKEVFREYLGVNPLRSTDRSRIDLVPDELQPLLPERFDPRAFAAFEIPLELCAGAWAGQIAVALAAFGVLPAERVLTLRYEDFFDDAMRQLDTLAKFLGDEFVDEDWSARCAAKVRAPRASWRDLPEDGARALTDACRPGFEALAAAGVHYAA